MEIGWKKQSNWNNWLCHTPNDKKEKMSLCDCGFLYGKWLPNLIWQQWIYAKTELKHIRDSEEGQIEIKEERHRNREGESERKRKEALEIEKTLVTLVISLDWKRNRNPKSFPKSPKMSFLARLIRNPTPKLHTKRVTCVHSSFPLQMSLILKSVSLPSSRVVRKKMCAFASWFRFNFHSHLLFKNTSDLNAIYESAISFFHFYYILCLLGSFYMLFRLCCHFYLSIPLIIFKDVCYVLLLQALLRIY